MSKHHWAAKYKASKTGTVERRIYLAACSIICRKGQEGEHQQVCEAVGKLAHENGYCIWHALYEYRGRKDTCYCVSCCKARNEKVVCLP
jgi:hypothetical protein